MQVFKDCALCSQFEAVAIITNHTAAKCTTSSAVRTRSMPSTQCDAGMSVSDAPLHACGMAAGSQAAHPAAAPATAATPLICNAELQGQPYTCQGKPGSSGPTYHVPKGCGAKYQYPTYILGKVRGDQNALERLSTVGVQSIPVRSLFH